MYKSIRIVRTSALLAVLSAGGGCSAIDRLSQIGEAPKLNAIENPTAQPGYKPVQMPMPKPEVASYNANSLWRNGSRAFFKDQRARQIGDLLTVTHRQGQHRQREPAQPQLEGRFRDHRLHRRQDAGRAGAKSLAGPHPADRFHLELRRQGFCGAAGKPADQCRRRE